MQRVDWTLPGLSKLIFAIPNGGKRDAKVGAMLKAEGVKSGVPDICVAIPRNGYHGLWIELKRIKGAHVSAAQRKLLRKLSDLGYRAEIATGAERAWEILCDYLDLELDGSASL